MGPVVLGVHLQLDLSVAGACSRSWPCAAAAEGKELAGAEAQQHTAAG
jgi:hypothetical protein